MIRPTTARRWMVGDGEWVDFRSEGHDARHLIGRQCGTSI